MNENSDTLEVIKRILSSTKSVRRIPFSEFPRIFTPPQMFHQVLTGLAERGLIDLKNRVLEVSKMQRVRLALAALTEDQSLETISQYVEWDEFEQLLSTLFTHHDYTIRKNLHIKHRGKRFQIDILAVKDRVILCVDCKQWRGGYGQSRMRTAVKKQETRAKAITPPLLRSLKINRNKTCYVVPVIIVLLDIPLRFIENTPIVPVYRLNSFLNDLPPIPDPRFKYFTIKDVDDNTHLSYEAF